MTIGSSCLLKPPSGQRITELYDYSRCSTISFTSLNRSRGNSSGGSYCALSSFPIDSCMNRRKIAASLVSGPIGRFQSIGAFLTLAPLGVSRGSDVSFLRNLGSYRTSLVSIAGRTLHEEFKQQRRRLYRFFESRGEGCFSGKIWHGWDPSSVHARCGPDLFSKPVKRKRTLLFSDNGGSETPLDHDVAHVSLFCSLTLVTSDEDATCESK
jgi:hypothetical protein